MRPPTIRVLGLSREASDLTLTSEPSGDNEDQSISAGARLLALKMRPDLVMFIEAANPAYCFHREEAKVTRKCGDYAGDEKT